MVDDKTIREENQSSVPQPLQPEEAPPDLTATPQPLSPQPVVEPLQSQHDSAHHDGRTKYFVVGGAVLFFVVVFGLIMSLIFGRTTKQENITLTFWGLWEEKETYKPLIDEYQKKNSHVKINYQKMVPADYREKIIARSKTGDGPDIYTFHNTWLPELRDVASKVPTSVMSGSEFEKTFYPIHTKDLKIGESYYGIPLSVDGLVLVYNDTLFKQAGIGTSPVSWEDVIDSAAKLTVKNPGGQIVTSGIALGSASNVEHFSDIFALFLAQNGGSISRLNEQEAEGALESYRRFAEIDVGFWDDLMPNSLTAFTQEKVAMIIVPSWQINMIKSANPDIALKVVPVPVIPGSKPLSIATYWVEGVSQKSKNQIEAWKFLKFLSEKESMTKLFEQQSKTRLFGSAYSRLDLAPLLAQNEYLGPVVKQAEEGAYVSVPLISRTYDNGLNDNNIAYIENAINQTAQGVSYQQALTTAHEGVQVILKNFQFETSQ